MVIAKRPQPPRVRGPVRCGYVRIARGGGSGWWLVGRAGPLVVVAVLVAALWGSPSRAQVDVPAAPAGLSYTATHESVTLTWDDPGDSSITGYQILRRARTGGATLVVHVDDTGSAATLYVDSNVVAGGEYVYWIKARNGAGLSEQSQPLEVDVPDPPAEPESAVVGGSVVTLIYGPALDEGSVPAAGAFSVTVGGSVRDVESVEVDGDRVRLRLVSVVQAGSMVALDYTAPADNPLRESGGGPSVADLDGRSVVYTTHIHRELAVEGQYRLGGVWSDGDTMWVGKIQPLGSNHYLRAFDVSTGLRDSAKDVRITTGVDARRDITGLWSDGDYMWVLTADFGERAARIYAYRLNPGASDHGRRSPSRDIELQFASPYSNWSPGGIWSDGETMWVANDVSDSSIDYATQVWAYRMNPGGADHGRVLRDKEFLLFSDAPAEDLLARNSEPEGVWSDGETLWVMDGGNCGGVLLALEFCHAFAYILNPGAENHGRRVPSREFTLDMRRHPDTITGEEGEGFERKWPQLIAGTWSDGSTIWVQGRGKLAGGHIPNPDYGDKQVIGVPLPLYVRSARVDGAELVLAYNDVLDASSVPPAGSFSVTVNGSARTVSSVGVDGERVLLTLASAVGFGDAVELSYTSPGTNPLKSTGGYTRQRTFSAAPDWVTNPADDLDGERVANLTSTVITASSGLSSTSVGGLWADGEVLWVVEDESDRLLSYRLDTASAGTTVTLAAANRDPAGVWSGGDRVWVADHADDKIYAYDAAGTAVPAEDISTLATAGNNDPRGIWSDGTVMWVVDRRDRRVYAYLVADGTRVEDREMALDPDNADAYGAWSDGATLWVTDRADAKLYAYSLVGSAHADGARREIVAGVRVPGWDVTLPDGVAATGVWANADAVWVADDRTDTVQAYPIRGVSVAPRFTLGRDPRDSRYPKRSGPLDTVAFKAALDAAVGTDVGHPVTAVSAVGSSITYSVGGDDRSDFDIDGSTGQLSAAKVLDFTDGSSYSLVVVATDSEDRTDRAKVVVTTPSPVLDSLTVDDDEVEIEYNRPLDEGSVPGTGAYTVDVSGSTVEVTDVDVGGDTVTVTIGARLWSFDTVRVTYTAPAAGAVRAAGEDGEQARSFTSRRASNRTSNRIGSSRVLESMWSDGTTLWVATRTGGTLQSSDGRLLAIDLQKRSRDERKDIDLPSDSSHAVGVWSDGATVWVASLESRWLYAYTRAGARDQGKDIRLHSENDTPQGIWSDGNVMWVADLHGSRMDNKIFAYDLADGDWLGHRDIDLGRNKHPIGLWSDGVTLWVADWGDSKVYAYTMGHDVDRDPDKEFTTSERPWGLWSDGTVMWISHNTGGSRYLEPRRMEDAVTDPTFVFNQTVKFLDENPSGVVDVELPVRAVDADHDTLTYTLSGTDADSFDLDPSTGQLRTKADVVYNYEVKSLYRLIVTAAESGGASDSIEVFVRVQDVPEPPAAPGELAFSEIGLSTVKVSWAEPSDTGDGYRPRYQLRYRRAGASGWEDGGDSTGTSAVLSDLARGARFEVQVRMVTTTGESGWSGSGTVTTVANSPPAFPPDEVTLQLDENTGPGRPVGAAVTADDPDGDTLSYSLGGTHSGSFTIDSGSGQLSTKEGEVYDFETRPVYSVWVSADDGHGGTDQVTVRVQLQDVDEPPTISGPTSVEFAENGTGTVAGYRARDPERETVTWESLAGPDHDDFELSANGALTFKSPPNHEDQSEYQVTLSVSDGNFTGTLDVMVTVTNVNETPTVSGLEEVDYVENGTTPLDTYTASDPENGDITWSLAGTDHGDFEISDSGELTFSRTPDYEDPADSGRDNEYEVTVRASDGRRTGTRDVVVTVTDVDEAPTVSGQDSIGYAENGTTPLDTYTADDPENDDLTWSLAGDDADVFAIAYGVLTFGEVPDRERPVDFNRDNVYLVTVRAWDGNSYGTRDVVVTVTNVDEAPVISVVIVGGVIDPVSGEVSRDYAEDLTDRVGLFLASDPEESAVTLSLAGADWDVFELSGSGLSGSCVSGSCELRFGELPDFESPADSGGNNVYEVTVRAGDGNSHGTRDVVVTVTNDDEDGTVSLSSSQPQVGTDLGAVLSDPDRSVTAVTWEWERSRNRNGSWATIGGAASDAYTPVDGDEDYFLRVMASYSDGEGSGKTAGEVSANPVQEAPREPNTAPYFPSSETGRREVDENTDPGKPVGGPVAANDDNAGDTLTYRLEGGDAASFRIGESSGQLLTEAVLDYEKKRSYSVRVVVTDTSGETDTIGVRVDVDNVDEPPDLSGPVAVDYEENRRDMVASYTAVDPEGDRIEWTRVGDDADALAIDSRGVLTFGSPPDYEAPTDSGGDNTYEVTVKASDGTYTPTPNRAVTVRVTNLDEDGTVTLTTATSRPQVNTAVEAALEDPDEVIGTIAWEWARSTNRRDWTPIDGTGTASYTPTSDDVGHYLQATATYNDREGSTKVASAHTAGTVVDPTRPPPPPPPSPPSPPPSPPPGPSSGPGPGPSGGGGPEPLPPGANHPPEFSEGSRTMRMVAENSPAGTDIGGPVTATDPEDDALAYKLAGSSADSFDLDTATGQLKTRAALDYETTNSYTITVEVRDGKNPEGEADRRRDDSIRVTIMVGDRNDAGWVTLSAPTPRVDQPIEAVLSDPDGDIADLSWVWERSTDRNTWTPIPDATTNAYTPTPGDADHHLRVTATYSDPFGPDQAATAAPPNPVTVGHTTTFTDVNPEGVHAPAINALAADGIFVDTECGEGLFCPDQPIQRRTMAIWLIRILGGDPPTVGESRFDDIAHGQWWIRYAEALADRNITLGCATNPPRYCPDRSVTRAQMASFLVRALQLPEAQTPAGFTDTEGNTHQANIDTLAAAGITLGCDTDPLRYCPDQPVTRAQMATFLHRALNYQSQ